MKRLDWSICFILLTITLVNAQPPKTAEELLAEADRLAWLRAWARAEPLFAQAEQQFAAKGDRRNELYAQIGRLRGELPRLPVAEVSDRLAAYLEDPVVKSDDRLRLRCLIVKGETDEDYDPTLAEQSWREAIEVARRLNDKPWENRANGELGIMAAVQGNTGAGVMMISNALKTARENGDLASQVRWYSIMGMGYVQFGRYEEALKLFDRAFDAGRSVEELQFPAMTCLGKANALVKLKRFKEATGLLDEALAMAQRRGSLGYQAELLKNAGMIANEVGDRAGAIAKLEEAADYAQRANANRILAEVYLELGKIQQQAGHPQAAAKALQDGIAVARQLRERFLLPRLLSQSAKIAAEQGHIAEASGLLEEATDVLEGLLVGATSPWLKSRLIGVMDEVFVARIRLEAEHGRDPRKIFAFVEQARGRVLADLLIAGPAQNTDGPRASSAGEKELAKQQARLWTAKGRSERKAVLDRIFLLESDMAPASAQAFQSSQAGSPRRPMTLPEFQRILRPDEILLEFVLLEPASYCLVVTRESAAVRTLPGRASTGGQVRTLLKDVHEGKPIDTAAHSLGDALLGGSPELARKQRLIVVPDGELHRVPFELLSLDNAEMLLRSHVITYAPSASAIALLRRKVTQRPSLMALAVSASPDTPQLLTAAQPAPFGSVSRGVYDLDGASLPPLPSANDEARAVVAILGNSSSKLLLGDEATEQNLKRQPLNDYDVLHFAVHGLVSTKFPERSALVLRYKLEGGEDSFLQAREILALRLNADLVTLSACETGSGALFGQEGVSNLVRPFLAAGARSVVANLWAADDTFSLALMKEFYRQLAAGKETAVALQQAKLAILRQFGSEALPKFWSGLILYGDGARTIRVRQCKEKPCPF